jgi:two-component system KDP operon response regulator KdpE
MENKKTILIVDDDQDFVQLLSTRLVANNYHTLFAGDAISAINRAVEVNPDLILLDIGLPAGDGFVIMERLKNIASLALTPVIVLSAHAPKFNKERVLKAGAKAFFQKPPKNEELLKAIRDALGNSGEESTKNNGGE